MASKYESNSTWAITSVSVVCTMKQTSSPCMSPAPTLDFLGAAYYLPIEPLVHIGKSAAVSGQNTTRMPHYQNTVDPRPQPVSPCSSSPPTIFLVSSSPRLSSISPAARQYPRGTIHRVYHTTIVVQIYLSTALPRLSVRPDKPVSLQPIIAPPQTTVYAKRTLLFDLSSDYLQSRHPLYCTPVSRTRHITAPTSIQRPSLPAQHRSLPLKVPFPSRDLSPCCARWFGVVWRGICSVCGVALVPSHGGNLLRSGVVLSCLVMPCRPCRARSRDTRCRRRRRCCVVLQDMQAVECGGRAVGCGSCARSRAHVFLVQKTGNGGADSVAASARRNLRGKSRRKAASTQRRSGAETWWCFCRP
ncbi:hypothetical protein IWX50DRAFT_703711 [Phyllosticta citricarpa]